MRKFRYILIAWVAALAVACDRSDDAGFGVDLPAGPSFDESTEWGIRMKEFYDKWGIWCQINVPSNDLFYAWTTSENWTTSALDYEYEDADPEYIVRALDFLEEEVMVNLPENILDEYVGLYIALEGRVFHSNTLGDELNYTSMEDWDVTTEYNDEVYGWNGSRHLLLAPVSSLFDEMDKEEIKRGWTALIFNAALVNLPNPDAFEENNPEPTFSFGYFYNEYIYDESGTHESGWEEGSDFIQYDPYSAGYVTAGPLLAATLGDGYDDEDAKTGYYVCIQEWYDTPTILDAFADYVAYIMYASAEEKAEVRSMNSRIEENEQIVKDYCKQYLNWDIPELGE